VLRGGIRVFLGLASVVSLDRQTPENVTKHMTKLLVGEADWITPGGTLARLYFRNMTFAEALEEFDQVFELPEGFRMRELQERIDVDERNAAG
jgi:hypothetical protein